MALMQGHRQVVALERQGVPPPGAVAIASQPTMQAALRYLGQRGRCVAQVQTLHSCIDREVFTLMAHPPGDCTGHRASPPHKAPLPHPGSATAGE